MTSVIRRTAKLIAKYPPLYNFLVKMIVKIPFLNAYFIESSDKFSHKFAVSVKGVVIRDGCVVLLKNERNEWELPGGKLEPGETPEACVVREINEELNLEVKVARLLDVWTYAPTKNSSVLIVTFGCVETIPRDVKLSVEHEHIAWFSLSEVDGLNMPEGYKHSVLHWSRDSS
jgi:mutator protein MutT